MNDLPVLKKCLLSGEKPFVAEDAFVARGAYVIGAVDLREGSSVWYGAVLRGDINRIVIGARSNVQDGAVIHVSDDFGAVVEEDVTIGHRAVVHACRVGAGSLIGMGAILLDGCEIGAGSVVAAGALVPKGMRVPPGSLVAGLPGRVARSVSQAEIESNNRLARKYVELAARHRAGGWQHPSPGFP
jgi:carbonic anhydrase/acetyltransferase-like protein (isoleucine patch superfamily)